jgi:hypothetical protein
VRKYKNKNTALFLLSMQFLMARNYNKLSSNPHDIFNKFEEKNSIRLTCPPTSSQMDPFFHQSK